MSEHSFDGLILSKTVRDLHTLSTFNGSKQEYEGLLRATIANIVRLLSYDSKLYRYLQLSSHYVQDSNRQTVLLDVLFLFYVNKSQTQPNVSKQSLLQHLKAYNQKSHESINLQLIELLAANSAAAAASSLPLSSTSGLRLSSSYSVVLTKFSSLLDHFIRLHRESERKLVEYINECFNYELLFFSTLRSRLDSDIDINDEDTHQIVQSLDNIIGISPPQVDQSEDSMFVIEKEPDSKYTGASDTGFTSNDPTFTKLYQLFLQLCTFKHQQRSTPSISGSVDFREYIRIMIGMYKKQVGTEFLELNDFSVKDLKFNFFYEKFLGSNNEDLFPMKYKEITEKVANEVDIFPEVNQANSYDLYHAVPQALVPDILVAPLDGPNISNVEHLSSLSLKPDSSHLYNHTSLTSVAQELTPSDQGELITNLKIFIPQLNKFFDFDPLYPRIMKHFIYLLNDPSSEVYVDVEDFEYLGKILNLVNILVDYENDDNEDILEENVRIQDTMREFYQLHLYLTKEDVHNSLTLLMRWAVYDFYSNLKLYRKYFQNWNYKTLETSQLEYLLDNHWQRILTMKYQERYLTKWYVKYKRNNELGLRTNEHYERLLIENTFRKWQQKTVVPQELVYDFITRKKVDHWHRKLDRLKSMKIESENIYNKKLKMNALRLLIDSFNNKIELRSISDEFHKERQLRFHLQLKASIWNLWYNKVNGKMLYESPSSNNLSTSVVPEVEVDLDGDLKPLLDLVKELNPTTIGEKLRKLLQLEKYFTVSKFFKKWKLQYLHEVKLHQIKKLNNRTLLKFFLVNQWHKKYQLNKVANNKLFKVNTIILGNAFSNWKHLMELQSKANEYRKNKQAKKYLKIWRLKIAEKRVNSIANGSLSSYFKKWRLQLLLTSRERERDVILLQKSFKQWTENLKNVMVNNDSAIVFDNNIVLKKTFIYWMEQYIREQEYLQTADLNLQRKFLNLMMLKWLKITQLEKDYKKQRLNHKVSFSDKISMKLVINIWKQNYEVVFENKNQSKVQHFIDKRSNPLLLSRSIDIWMKNYNARQLKYHEMEQKCDQFINTSFVKANHFRVWKDKTTSVLYLNEKADELSRKLLYKKYLAKLYDEFMYTLEYLSDMAATHINQREIQKARQLLVKWSMRYKKHIKRQKDYCDDFIERWQTAKSRAIFEIWLFKLRAKRKAEEEDIVGNVSMNSPLSNKSSASQLNYLNTPLKKRENSRIPYTPLASRVSPTKLQETTEKIKSERVEKLIKHYQKVKSPERQFAADKIPRLDSTITKNDKQLSYSMIIPPKPPNFKRSSSKLSQNIEMSSDEEPESIFKRLSPTYDEEKSTIETAKQLRKITPIYVPTQDDMEPRFSLVSKLRERVQQISRLNSPQKTIDTQINSPVTSTPIK